MKKSVTILILSLFFLGINQVNATSDFRKEQLTAEDVLLYAGTLNDLTEENALILKEKVKSLSLRERIKLAKTAIKQAKEAKKTGTPEATEKAKPALYVLAVVMPPIAVGIHTDWGKPTLYNFLWSCLGWVPGIIHAFIVLGR